MGFWGKFSQKSKFPVYFCTGSLNFTIFVRARVSMTSQKPKTGYVGTLFGINAPLDEGHKVQLTHKNNVACLQ
jgi:hypothetical protein